MLGSVGVWMDVGCPCPPVRNDIVTPRHLFIFVSFLLRFNYKSELNSEHGSLNTSNPHVLATAAASIWAGAVRSKHYEHKVVKVGWINRQTDGWMDGRMDGRMDGQTDGWTDGQMDGRMEGRTKRDVESRRAQLNTLILGTA